MAVKACSTITLFQNIDIISTTYYYKLLNSLTTPNVPDDSVVDPTTSAGGSWSTSEPSYTEGSTSYLYYTIQTKFSNGTQSYSYSSIVSGERKACLSSSYEAAKAAYNKAVNAQNTANAAEKKIYHTCSSSGGTAGYFYFARCVITQAYANKPITFSVANRGIDETNVELRFANQNGTDPALTIFKKTGKANVYIVKADTSTWDLYVQKTESYDQATFNKFSMNGYDSKFTWTWKDTTVTSLPSGYRSAGDATEIIVGTQTAATGAWTGVASFDQLVDGQEITYWLPYNGSGNATLNLTLSNGTTTGAINCYYSGASRITTHYAAGNIIHLTYRVNASVAGTNYTGWWADANYVDGNTYDRIRFNQNITAGEAITNGQLIAKVATSFKKLVAELGFDVTQPVLLAGSDIASGGTNSNTYLSYPSVNITKTVSGLSLTAKNTCYLVGQLSGNTFTTKSSGMLTTTVPTSEDGYYYMSLGYMSSATNMILFPEHPIFRFINGSFKNIAQMAFEANDFTINVDTANENLWFNYQKPKADTTQWTTNPTEVIKTGLPNNNEYDFALRTSGITSYYVPYDKNKKYKAIGWLKTITSQASSTSYYYPSIMPYDFDNNLISWNNMMSTPTSNTTLAQDLKNGDTKVYITSTSNWPTGTANKAYYVGVFDDKSSKGYSYETYTRHIYQFAANGDNLNNIIDTTNKTVTLKSAYSGTTIPAGTIVSCTCAGSTYIYPWSGIQYKNTADWIYKELIFDSGFDIRLKEASYIRFYPYTNNVYYYGLSLKDYTADAAKEAASAAQSAATTAQSTADSAQSTATTAQSTATAAQSAATSAKADASEAKTAADSAQSTANQAKTDVENMKSYIKFNEHYTDATHNDVACIEIVAPTAGSTMSIRILPDKIGFYTGQNETAYLSNNALYISESTILKKEKIGHWETVEDSVGNLNTKWVE